MKKILLSVFAFSAIGASAQIYSCNDGAGFSTWTAYNNDSDTLNWTIVDVTSSGTALASQAECAISNSWTNANGALTPDNMIISAAISLPAGATSITLAWGCGSPETIASGFADEHYACYVVTATDLPGIIGGTYPTPVFEGTLAVGEAMEPQSVSLTSMAGQSVYLVYRHFNCTDNNYILLDDIVITGTFAGVEEPDAVALSLYPNPSETYLNITSEATFEVATVSDMGGRVILNQQINSSNAEINVADLTAGMYVIVLKTVDGTVIRRTFEKK